LTWVLTYWRVGLVAALLAAAGVWHLTDKSKAVEDSLEVLRAEYINQALAASESARAREQLLIAINQKASLDLQAQKTRSAAAAVVSAGKLRDLDAALDRANSSRSDPAATAGVDDPSAGIIRECSRALVAVDDFASKLAWQLTGLQRYVGEVCQADP
jgi:hypothetical protein